ncbi:DUF1475 family protein [Isachenkonia alkalipeptolytica]|uniref:DUF1475 domain-containing protein n=1 Tax=Isachenkonia alkalipeptolytica TaxID=2565777 RepID=A0AA43XP15_9CLOT|nr:DUF1475 family protein [Isachenkonia alkalipeptolytica]NBG89679.1 DUF1475 domain-containing protein [Isachenkonia alkalipeptolytica]
MRWIKLLGWLGVGAMTVVIGSAFINGSFTEDGGALLQNPWGIVSLVDLYVGFVLFSIWIVLREEKTSAIILWVAAMMILGFFTGSLYVLKAAYESKGDKKIFLMGTKG